MPSNQVCKPDNLLNMLWKNPQYVECCLMRLGPRTVASSRHAARRHRCYSMYIHVQPTPWIVFRMQSSWINKIRRWQLRDLDTLSNRCKLQNQPHPELCEMIAAENRTYLQAVVPLGEGRGPLPCLWAKNGSAFHARSLRFSELFNALSCTWTIMLFWVSCSYPVESFS